MSPIKEPHFYSTDLKSHDLRRTTYESLFRGASDAHIAVGEASVYYLFSRVAVPKIEHEIKNARYIVMVRNPVEMAYSFHDQHLFGGREHVIDFEEAWRLSPQRREGHMVTHWYPEPRLLDYQSVCMLGKQLKRLLGVVPRERVLVLVLDDVKENPRREYLKVLDFLGVRDDGRMEFPVRNPAKERRWPWLRRAVVAAGRVSHAIKRNLGLSTLQGTGVLNALNRRNLHVRERPPLSPELRAELIEYFQDDIRLLSRLLNRDFSNWLNADVHG